jgi:hypothetical protein
MFEVDSVAQARSLYWRHNAVEKWLADNRRTWGD